jgi:prepilin-type N-terminal cleavage/methylation domain-containing protein
MNKRGFTIIEMLLVAALLSIIILAAFTVLTTGKKSWQVGVVKTELQQEARRAMDVMVRELRNAGAIDTNSFDGNGLSTDFIKFTLQGATVEYEVIANRLERAPVGLSPVLANDVSSVDFYLSGNDDVVYIILTTGKTAASGYPVQAILSSQAVLRN